MKLTEKEYADWIWRRDYFWKPLVLVMMGGPVILMVYGLLNN